MWSRLLLALDTCLEYETTQEIIFKRSSNRCTFRHTHKNYKRNDILLNNLRRTKMILNCELLDFRKVVVIPIILYYIKFYDKRVYFFNTNLCPLFIKFTKGSLQTYDITFRELLLIINKYFIYSHF